MFVCIQLYIDVRDEFISLLMYHIFLFVRITVRRRLFLNPNHSMHLIESCYHFVFKHEINRVLERFTITAVN